MRVHYPQRFKVILSYDGVFQVHLFENDFQDMESILEIVKEDFKQYPDFEYCNIINIATWEVLAVCYNHD